MQGILCIMAERKKEKIKENKCLEIKLWSTHETQTNQEVAIGCQGVTWKRRRDIQLITEGKFHACIKTQSRR